MHVTLCLYARAYWRRLSYSLSSLVQSDFNGTVRITALRDDPYLKELDQLLTWFSAYKDACIPITVDYLPGWGRNRRGHLVTSRRGSRVRSQARSNDIAHANEWLLWSRPDMVYSPLFFSELEANIKHLTEPQLITWPRLTMTQESGDALIAPGVSYYPDAYNKAHPYNIGYSGGPMRQCCGAGYAQFIHTDWLKQLGIVEYSNKLGSHGDTHIRQKVGKLHKYYPTNPPIHLQHDRIDENPK